jgi:hypothetical protein
MTLIISKHFRYPEFLQHIRQRKPCSALPLAGVDCFVASFFASRVRRSFSKALSSLRSPVSDGFGVGCRPSGLSRLAVIISLLLMSLLSSFR